MKCDNCGAELTEGVNFCPECGHKIEFHRKRFCRECGAEYAEGANFCSVCGAKMQYDSEKIYTDVKNVETTKNENGNQAECEEETVGEQSLLAKQTKEKIDSVMEKVTKEAKDFYNKFLYMLSSLKKKVSDFICSFLQDEKKKRTLAIITAAIGFIVLIFIIAGVGKLIAGKSKGAAADAEDSIEVVNVIDMTYSDAIKKLKDAGFTNVVSNIEDGEDLTLWIVSEQSISAGEFAQADEKIELTCGIMCKLYLDISSESNLLFNKYDIAILLDGKEIGSVSNGSEFTYLADLISGSHELEFRKTGNESPKAVKKLDVSNDMTYSCELYHDRSSISMKNEKYEENVENATLEVVDVTEMILSDAIKTLENIGFSNLREEPYGSIWDRDNWIVTKQGLAPGTVADKNEFIQLDCISLDEYFENNYVGKNVNEVQKLAKEEGFSLYFEDTLWNDINDKVATMDESTKEKWVVTSACQYAGDYKTAIVIIEDTEATEETAESAAENKDTNKEDFSEKSSDTETSSSVETSDTETKEYSDSKVETCVSEVLGSEFESSEYKVSVSDSLINIYFTIEGTTLLAYNACEVGDASSKKQWDEMVSSAQELSCSLSDYVSEDLKRSDLYVTLYYCHDLYSSNVLLIVMNGIVCYDFVNDIDLLN